MENGLKWQFDLSGEIRIEQRSGKHSDPDGQTDARTERHRTDCGPAAVDNRN